MGNNYYMFYSTLLFGLTEQILKYVIISSESNFEANVV